MGCYRFVRSHIVQLEWSSGVICSLTRVDYHRVLCLFRVALQWVNANKAFLENSMYFALKLSTL